MSLWRIAWRYLWSRPLVTGLTLIGVGLGAALIAGVLTLRRETESAFVNEGASFDLVVGAKGSPLQLVLSTIYHLDAPTGNIDYSILDKLKGDPRVRAAYPIGLGDNYRGFRIVGTTPDFFSLQKRNPDTSEWRQALRMAQGRPLEKDFEAVVGSLAARRTGLKIGDAFVGAHGLAAAEVGAEEHAEFPYAVVGILAPNGSANDRAIFTTIGSIWKVHEEKREERKELAAGSEEAAAFERPKPREATAILVQLQMPGLRQWMAKEIQQTTSAMAAVPILEMLRLYQQVLSPVQRALLGIAYIVVVASALTILATLYQAAERRRRDIAILRALGAHRREIFALMLLEALFVTLLGVAGGWAAGHLAVNAAGLLLQRQTGMIIGGWTTDPTEFIALAVVAAVGALAGLGPALAAYRRSPAADMAGG
ncbi:MAG: ABC transporter permease [Candidatus Sumerlaeota bacterium]|nr:ABC transporter permease [Candidatus Sumerlaeota bacterium]